MWRFLFFFKFLIYRQNANSNSFSDTFLADTVASCAALAPSLAILCNGLPGSIQIRRPARAARTVKQRGMR